MLNNKPYFMNGVLDQGYYSDGLLTPPSVEAMKFDIEETKSLGYNMLRKHIKIEPMLWYYLCDRLGMIVWQDMVNSGTKYSALLVIMLPFIKIQKIKDKHYRWFGRRTKENKDWFVEEMRETITQLYNCVSISEWTVFNEGWGQFDAKEMAKLARSMDRSRIVDHASGWHDQGGGDLKSLHVYFRPIKPKQYRDNRAIVVSEFGGYSYKEAEHSYNSESTYSYNRLKDKKSFNIAVENLYRQEIIPYIPLGLCASVYTQVSDVEDEVNGLYTYDRKICKVDKETMRKFNAEVKL
ncbi:MAG: glycoside hydrolase family 2 TIM barrel-domain containing protein [Clostridia bacterium]